MIFFCIDKIKFKKLYKLFFVFFEILLTNSSTILQDKGLINQVEVVLEVIEKIFCDEGSFQTFL